MPGCTRAHGGQCHCLLGRAAPGAQGDLSGDGQALRHPGPVWLPELRRGQTQQRSTLRPDEGALSFQALGPAGHGAPGLSGTPSWLHLPLAQRCQMGCEDGGAAGMGWPPQGCSRERPQDSVCARAVGGRGARVRGVQGGTTSTCNLGRAFPPATPPAVFLHLAEVVSGVWTVDAGLLAGPGGQCSIHVLSLVLQGGRGLSLVSVVGEACGKPAAPAAVGRLAGSAPWTARHPTPAHQAL